MYDKFGLPRMVGEENPFYKKQHSEETRLKMKNKKQELFANTVWLETVFLPARKNRNLERFRTEEFRQTKSTQTKQLHEKGLYKHRKLNDENNPMYGRKHSEETLEKQRQVKIGKYDGKNNPNFNKPHSLEAKLNISLSRTGTMRIHKDGKRKYIKQVLFPHYEKQGWERGF